MFQRHKLECNVCELLTDNGYRSDEILGFGYTDTILCCSICKMLSQNDVSSACPDSLTSTSGRMHKQKHRNLLFIFIQDFVFFMKSAISLIRLQLPMITRYYSQSIWNVIYGQSSHIYTSRLRQFNYLFIILRTDWTSPLVNMHV